MPDEQTQSPSVPAEAGTPTVARHWVLAFTLALTAVSYLDRVCISMAAPFIQDDLHLHSFSPRSARDAPDQFSYL